MICRVCKQMLKYRVIRRTEVIGPKVEWCPICGNIRPIVPDWVPWDKVKLWMEG